METRLSFQTQKFKVKKIEITTISAKGKGISIFTLTVQFSCGYVGGNNGEFSVGRQ